MVNILNTERDKHRQGLGSECSEGVNLSCAEGHNRIQSVELLKFQYPELAKMFSCGSQERFGVLIELFFCICRMHKGNNGKHHSLISCGQVIEKLFHFFFLLLHIVRNGSRKVVVGVLPALPVRYIRLNAKQSALRFTHRFVGGNGYNINRHHQIAVKVCKLRHHTILDIRRIFTKKKHSAVAISDFEIVAFKLHRIRADIILEIVSFLPCFLNVKMKRAFLTDSVKVVENSQSFIRFKLGAFASESAEVGDQVCADTGKVVSCFLNVFLVDRDGNILVLHNGVCSGGFFKQHFVVFLTVHIKLIAFQRQKNGFLKVQSVQPAVVDCNFGSSSAVKGI